MSCPLIGVTSAMLWQLKLSSNFRSSALYRKVQKMNNDLAAIFGGAAFDPATVEPQTDFPVLPPSKYPVLIEEAEVKQTKKGDGHYIRLVMKVLDEGLYKGRKVFDQINIQNPSTQCVEIGLRSLSALGRALGLQAITDSTQLVNQVVVAHVKVKDDQNIVRTYSSAGVAPPAPAPAPAHPAGMPAIGTPETYAPPQSTPAVAPQRAAPKVMPPVPAAPPVVAPPAVAPPTAVQPPWAR